MTLLRRDTSGAAGVRRAWSPGRRLLLLALLAGAVQIVFGALSWVVGLNDVPPYGDTPEYLDLARTLRFDEYRTIGYLLVLRPFSGVSDGQLAMLYALQTAALCVVTTYLLMTVVAALPHSARALLAGRHGGVLLLWTAGVVVSAPLLLHYAEAVLTDSLATSASVLSLAAITRIALLDDRRPITFLLSVLAASGAVLLRAEKGYVLVGGAVLAVLLVQSSQGRRTSSALLLVLVVLVPVTAATAVNRATQTADQGRPALTVSALAFNRTVWPRMSDVHPHLPPETRAAFPPDRIADFDDNNYFVFEALQRFRAADGGGERHVRQATATALACCWADILRDTGRTSVEYLLAPITFAGQSLTGTGTWTSWNSSRLAEAHPRQSWVWTRWSFLVLALLLVVAGRSAGCGWRWLGVPGRRTVLLLVAGSSLHGLLFAATSGLEANVRYALPAVLVLQVLLGLTVVLGWLAGRRPDVVRTA